MTSKCPICQGPAEVNMTTDGFSISCASCGDIGFNSRHIDDDYHADVADPEHIGVLPQ